MLSSLTGAQMVGSPLSRATGLPWSAAGSEAVRVAIASGHGIGKSALVAWIILSQSVKPRR